MKKQKLTKEQIEQIIGEIKSKLPSYKKTRKENLSCKLTEEDIIMIKYLKEEIGAPVKLIAAKYNVIPWTIYYWTSEKVHNGALERTRKRANQKYKNDEEYKKSHISRNSEYYAKRCKSDKRFREYTRLHSKKQFLINQLKKINGL